MTTTTHDRPSAPAASGKAVLEATGVIMRFGGLTAVNNVNLRVNEGEIVGLIGPNGAGKTTFFNCLTGMYKPTEGEVKFQGTVLPPKPRAVVQAGRSQVAVGADRNINVEVGDLLHLGHVLVPLGD